MEATIIGISPMPNNAPDIIVAYGPDGKLIVFEPMPDAGIKGLMLNDRISLDWDSGPGDAFNVTNGARINLNILAIGLTPQEVKERFIPNYPA